MMVPPVNSARAEGEDNTHCAVSQHERPLGLTC